MKIRRLALKNFKCYRNQTFEFADGVNIISGRNATGKTTIADAICWCLFNQDYAGRSNPQVRNDDCDDGDIVSVRIEAENTFERTQLRVPSGSGYADTNDYFLNGEKCSRGVFDAMASGLIYGMLPKAFLKESDDFRRRKLTAMYAGDIDDQKLAKRNRLAELARLFSNGLSLDGIITSQKEIITRAKKQVTSINGALAALKALVAEREDVPAAELELQKAELDRMWAQESCICKTCGNETSARAKELVEEMKEIDRKLSGLDTSAEDEQIETLEKNLAGAVQMQASAEKVLFQIDALEEQKNVLLDEKINSQFKYIKWQFSVSNKSGAKKNVCIPTHDGRSLLDASSNKAARLLAQIEICQKLGAGLNAPMIIDDAESLDNESLKAALEGVTGQVLLLKVTNEKDLHVKEMK